MSVVQPMMISGAEVWPLIEGGKGVAVTNGRSSGAWAAAIPGIAAVPLRQDQGIHRAEGGKKV